MDTVIIQESDISVTVQESNIAVAVQENNNAVTITETGAAVNVHPTQNAVTILSGATINNYGSSSIVVGEIPNGTINGSNATFTTDYDFVPESVLFFRNGLAQYNPTHYTTSGTTTINLNFSPIVGDVLTVNYTKA